MVDKKDLNYKVDRVQSMINDRDESSLEEMYEWMDNAFRSYAQLPDELQGDAVEWIHRVTSTQPHDAVRTGARSLSTYMPRVTMYPLLGNEDSREVANSIEKALEWQFKQATERRNVSLLHDTVLSALLYDEVIISVWYLPAQVAILKKWGIDSARLKNAQRYGDYVIKVHKPRDAVVEYSDLMAERVVFKTVVPVQEVIDYWGERAETIRWMTEQEAHKNKEYMALYDYSEIGHRAVFGYLQEDVNFENNLLGTNPVEILNEPVPYDFLPVASKVGGTSLAHEGQHQRIPLLWSIYNSGQWETQNLVETLLVSEGLAYSVTPRYAVENEYDNDEPDMDFRDPARIVNLKRGQRLHDLRPPALNDGMMTLSGRIMERMDNSTVPRFLQSGEASGSFSSVNLQSQAGMKSIAPYKKLAESTLSEMFEKMLLWIHHSGKPLMSYVPKNNVIGRDEENNPKVDVSVEEITVDGDSFDPKNIYLSVELTEDAPDDIVAKVNAGGMMVERLNYPYAKAMEFIGETDPEGMLELRRQEELRLAERQADIQRIMNESSIEVMQMQEEMRKSLEQVQQMMGQLQQMMAEAQAQGQGQPQGQPGSEGGPMVAPDGSVSPQGQQMMSARGANSLPPGPGQPGGPAQPSPMIPTNPAEGDIPPIQGAPGMGLREQVQGGEEV